MRHVLATQKRNNCGNAVNERCSPKVTSNQMSIKYFGQRQVRGKTEQHRRQGKIEYELGQIGRGVFREKPRAPSPVTQADQRKERNGTQKNLDHVRRLRPRIAVCKSVRCAHYQQGRVRRSCLNRYLGNSGDPACLSFRLLYRNSTRLRSAGVRLEFDR